MANLMTYFAQINVDHLPGSGSNVDPGVAAIPTAVTVVFSIFGVIAVLMITIGGFQYVISGGDPQRTAKAKNTILYAVVGLIITLSAYGIITFIIGRL